MTFTTLKNQQGNNIHYNFSVRWYYVSPGEVGACGAMILYGFWLDSWLPCFFLLQGPCSAPVKAAKDGPSGWVLQANVGEPDGSWTPALGMAFAWELQSFRKQTSRQMASFSLSHSLKRYLIFALAKS